jgi:hypothetical protein
LSIILPHVFQDGVNEVASGVAVNEDLNVLKAAIEAVEPLAPALLALAAGHKVAWGSGTCTWIGGSNASGVTTITHGLGVTPLMVQVTNTNGESTNQPVVYHADTKTATTFHVQGYGNGTAALGGTFDWLAIG